MGMFIPPPLIRASHTAGYVIAQKIGRQQAAAKAPICPDD